VTHSQQNHRSITITCEIGRALFPRAIGAPFCRPSRRPAAP